MFKLQATSSAHLPKTASLGAWIKQHALLAYILTTFGLTWPFMWAEVLGSWGLLSFRLTLSGLGLFLTLFIAYGPTLVALVITGVSSGRAGLRNLLGRLLIWRVGWQWYAIALFLPGIVGLGATVLYAAWSGATVLLPSFTWGKLPLILVSFLVHGLVNGEEIGWRGFALPYLQRRWNALKASLLLGAVWALFHLPIFFVQGDSILGSQNVMNPLAFLIEVLAGAILMTWLFNNTQGSLLIAYLYHAAVNTWTTEVFLTNNTASALITAIVAALVVVSFGPAHLTHTRGTKQW